MERYKINQYLEKYFNGQTTIKEEKEIKNYFSSDNIAPELLSYKSMFTYFSHQKTIHYDKKIVIHKKYDFKKWIFAATCGVVLFGIGITQFSTQQEYLGTFDSPEIAFTETQKALYLLSENLNKGTEKIYLIQEYENTKNKIFLPQKQ